MLLSHLKRTKKPCKALYDIKTLEAEAKAVQKEQMAVRNRDRYHNDPNESRRKKAASKEYYRKRIKEKESTNQKSHDEIHDTAEPPNLPKIPVRIVCDVCEKVFAYRNNLSRHMKEIHGENKYECLECCEEFSRICNLKRHIERGKHTFKVVCNYCDDSFFFKTDEEAKRKMMQHYTFGKMYPGTRNIVGCRWFCTRCIEFHCVNEANVSDEKREILMRRRLEEDDGNHGEFRSEFRHKVEVTDEHWQECLRKWRRDLKNAREEEERRIRIEEKVKKEKSTPFYCEYCKTMCIGILKKNHFGDWNGCKCKGCLVAGFTHECGRHECNDKKCKQCRNKNYNLPHHQHYLKDWKERVDSGEWKVDDSETYEKYVTQLRNHEKMCKKRSAM